jgi:hypothetical protein
MIGIGFGEFLAASAKKTGVEKYHITHPSFRLAWRAFRNPGNLMADARSEVTLFYSKLPKLPLAKPNILNWRHLTETKFRVIGK